MPTQTAIIPCQKHLFSLPTDVHYLKNAYMAPMMKAVEQAGIQAMERLRTPYVCGVADFFDPLDKLRQEFATLINVADPQRIVTIPSVSYGMAVVAKNIHISQGEKIVLIGEQFPSNVYVWQGLAAETGATIHTIEAPEAAENRGKIWNERLLEAITPDTHLVAMPHVHWADGTRYDLVAVRQRCNEVGALLIIDGTQSVGAMPFDVALIQPDALICAGYKWLMGPYALGVAYFGSYFNDGKPIEESWFNRYKSEEFANLVNYEARYQPGAMRFQVGQSSNFMLLPMLTVALETVNHWTPQNIQAYCETIITPALEELKNLGCQVESPSYRGHHLFGVRLPEQLSIAELRQRLDAAKIYVSVRGNAIRIAPHLYSEVDDMDAFVACVRAGLA